MSNQQMLFAETILGLKKALVRPFDASDSDDSITQPTNRGNKLKRKAKYVHEGTLDHPNGPKIYRRKIEHSGYSRYIISRNPPRVDGDGDEIEDEDESDEGAEDAYENPYRGIKLEHLLVPLTSAAELPTHPSMSVPYYSTALLEMVKNAQEMVHRENASLWRMKLLLTKFRGDETWIPCSMMQTNNDIFLFGKRRPDALLQCYARQNGLDISDQTHVDGDPHHPGELIATGADGPRKGFPPNGALRRGFIPNDPAPLSANRIKDQDTNDTSQHAAAGIGVNGHGANGLHKVDGIVSCENVHVTRVDWDSGANEGAHHTKGTDSIKAGHALDNGELSHIQGLESPPASPEAGSRIERDTRLPSAGEPAHEPAMYAKESTGVEEEKAEELKPVSRHMTTRAQAQASNENTPERTRSVSPMNSDPAFVHPFFLAPLIAQPDPDYGLPQREADDVRKLLIMYVQKQEEIVRGAQALSDGLMRADRMRMNVLRWTKAEGHLGEMSDGEDWYDKEEWGLEEELKKGHEEEEDEANAPGKKTRRARAER